VAPLHAESTGEGRTLVLAHGFTQTGRLWGRFGQLIAEGRRVVTVDLPGHGGSSEIEADLEAGGTLLVEAGGGEPFDLLGYSLGARFALHAALGAPQRVDRLILISGTAGIEDDDARSARKSRDEESATRIEAERTVDAFIESWLTAPMFATLRGADAGGEERRRNTPAGLASSLRLAGAGTQRPLWGRLGELTMPVLVLAGATDPRYQALGWRLAHGVAHGAFSVIPGAGHAAHLEQPDVTAAIVSSWLAATDPGPG
jgi:2-succinyl-6-hydroxy-2,4-cyclohexadiene-1-carboxylate synthase